jgi:CheY-like chemotaxis protein/HPt (histidine-containing phosphotransfer) domain-containing protein
VTTLRILHVDDDPDMREVVEMSLGLDPGFVTRSCSSGQEALVAALDWQPHIILCDVRMPVMDGPATLMRLRENALTASIPVIFMTARTKSRELDRSLSLGVLGVIPKPFDPMTLAASVRSYVQPAHDPLDDLRAGFLQRVRKDVVSLSEQRRLLTDGNRPPDVLDRIKRTAHGLSGAGGIYGFAEISDAAAALEDAVIAELADPGDGEATELALNGLIAHAENCGSQMMLPHQQTQPHDRRSPVH